MSSTLLLPPRAQLCNRSCSNKTHTHSLLSLSLHHLGRLTAAKRQRYGSTQCRGLWHSSSPSARSLSRSPSSSPPSFTSPSPTRSLVRDGQTSPHRPRLVVYRSTCPPLSPSPHANSFVLGTAVINTQQCSLRLCGGHRRLVVYDHSMMCLDPNDDDTHGATDSD